MKAIVSAMCWAMVNLPPLPSQCSGKKWRRLGTISRRPADSGFSTAIQARKSFSEPCTHTSGLPAPMSR